jgi:hypothetical protein
MLIKPGKKVDKKKLKNALKETSKKKVFQAKKHKGTVEWGEDPLAYQKRIRQEWDERNL